MLHKAIAPLARRVSNLLSRGAVALANSAGKLQTLEITLLADEGKQAVDHLEPFGFTSCPKNGAEVLAAFVEGDRSHGVVLVAADRRYRPLNLLAGEVCLYNAAGMKITLSNTGIAIVGGGSDITISGAPHVTVTGGDVIADGISLKTHKHGGVTAGAAQTGAPV